MTEYYLKKLMYRCGLKKRSHGLQFVDHWLKTIGCINRKRNVFHWYGDAQFNWLANLTNRTYKSGNLTLNEIRVPYQVVDSRDLWFRYLVLRHDLLLAADDRNRPIQACSLGVYHVAVFTFCTKIHTFILC